MELKKILVGLEGLKAKGKLDLDITGLESNSKKIKEGYMFIAIKGYSVDGHDYINNAIEAGAKVVMVQEGCDLKKIKLPADVTIIMAKDTREALAICSCNFYGNPSRKFKLIGVTGTKGKTTTTYMIKEILEKAGHKVGLIGTIATYINGKMISESARTTPESIELQKTFAQMVEAGVEYVVMEVNGIGYKIFMSKKSIDELEEDREVKVYTYLKVREDDVSLFGFKTNEELHMFELLISVGGIGAKSAITILSNITPSRFALAVITNDVNSLKKLQGIGPKTAQRIILELKDKIKTEEAILSNDNTKLEEEANSEEDQEELIQALQVLGYRRYEINKILSKIKSDNLEDKIREALQYLAK